MHVSISVLQFKVCHFWKTHYIPHLGEVQPLCRSLPGVHEKLHNLPPNVKGNLSEKSRQESGNVLKNDFDPKSVSKIFGQFEEKMKTCLHAVCCVI